MKFTSLYKLSEKDKEEILRKILPDKPPEEVMTVNKEMWQEFMDYADAQETKINDLKRRVDYLVQMSQYQYKQYESLRKELLSKIENSVEGLKETVSKDDNTNSVISEQPQKDEKPALKSKIVRKENAAEFKSIVDDKKENEPVFGSIVDDKKKVNLFSFEPLVDGEKEVEEISDSWIDIIASIEDCTYREKYKIGNYKPVNLGNEGVIRMQIAGFNVDRLLINSKRASITWIAMDVLKTGQRMNSNSGAAGGWKDSEMRAYLDMRIKDLFPVIVRRSMRKVKKYALSLDNTNKIVIGKETGDYLWIPSYQEVFGDNPEESSPPYYSALFADKSDRKRESWWWLRSVNNETNFYGVSSNGNKANNESEYYHGVVIGFCT